ncbi:MAG: amidohydrolase family protein [Actinomycetota bacterium]|nr:amidohydrolase family protein [Actinomycetota bacterium]
MLITADWVVPVASPPIRDGAILVRGAHIAAVGPAEELKRTAGDTDIQEYPGCIAMPGLVNAHTHLALSCLKGHIPPQPFTEWIKWIPIAWRALDGDDIAASISYGASRCIMSGTTVVGDIAYGPESISIAADAGLGGAFFWELLGVRAAAVEQKLYDADFPSDPPAMCSSRVRCGLSPHATYTSGPDLIRALHVRAIAQECSFAIHLAESYAEVQLLRDGTGPLADLAARLAHGFEAPGVSATMYLAELDALENAVLVHCTQTHAADMPVIARRSAGAVLCPRSNAYLHNGAPPAWRLAGARVRLALGTDSLASNDDLNLFEEARALRRLEPRFSAQRLVEMMTSEGATVLGLNNQFGTLEPGRQGDIAVYRIPPGNAPYEGLLGHAGRHTIEAVLSAGIWRVLHGAPAFSISPIERAAHLAGQKAALAIAFETRAL